jgi:serine/threonine protein kinase
LISKNPLGAVYSDFGVSFRPIELLDQKQPKPTGGTLIYMAPEHESNWSGQSASEQIENAKKSDVWSQGIMAYEVIYNRRPPMYPISNQIAAKPFFIEYSIDYDPLEHLLFRALEANPNQRMTSWEFRDALERLISRKSVLQDSGKKLGSSEKEQRYAKSMPEFDRMAQKLYLMGPGTFQIYSYKYRGKIKTGLYFVDSLGNEQFQIFNLPQGDQAAIHSEIDFLKSIGVLR